MNKFSQNVRDESIVQATLTLLLTLPSPCRIVEGIQAIDSWSRRRDSQTAPLTSRKWPKSGVKKSHLEPRKGHDGSKTSNHLKSCVNSKGSERIYCEISHRSTESIVRIRSDEPLGTFPMGALPRCRNERPSAMGLFRIFHAIFSL